MTIDEIVEFEGAYITTSGMCAYRFHGTHADHDLFREEKRKLFEESIKGQLWNTNT